jgi:hypothetical protein
LAAGLIHAVVYWPSAAFDLVLPLRPGLDLQMRPGLAVPILVGLTQGPIAGLITGLVGQLVGELLAGRWSGGWSIVISVGQSGLFGLIAGLGHPGLRQFRTLRALGHVLLWAAVAGLGGQLLPLVAVLVFAQFRPDLLIDLNVIASGVVTFGVNALLLLPGLFVVWERLRPRTADV